MLIHKSFNFKRMVQIFQYIISYIFNFPKMTKAEGNWILELDDFISEPFN